MDVNELKPGAVIRGPALPEAIEVLVGFGEGLLHDVQRVLATPQYSECQCGNLALVTLDQLAEGFAIAGPGPLDELPVASRHRTLARGKT